MIIFKKAMAIRSSLDIELKKNKKIGFIPTMGALHMGHLSLIEKSKSQDELTVCSIFVNPTQFNDPSDYDNYPVTLEKDIELLENAGCDILFLPGMAEIYPLGTDAVMKYNLGHLEQILEGKFRPGHFQGVCMVVHRLLNIIAPQHLYIGQKDYQQCMVITRLAELIGLSDKLKIIICPTLREPDGLAMSSRNLRLSPEERRKAPSIYQALSYIRTNRGCKTPDEIKAIVASDLSINGFKVDYVEIANSRNLEPLKVWDEKQEAVALVAAFINKDVRLIDNVMLYQDEVRSQGL